MAINQPVYSPRLPFYPSTHFESEISCDTDGLDTSITMWIGLESVGTSMGIVYHALDNWLPRYSVPGYILDEV